MPTPLDSLLASIVARTATALASDIAKAVRHSIASEIAGKASAGAAAKTPALKASISLGRRSGKRARRTATQMAADDLQILEFVKGHGGLRSGQLEKQLKISMPVLASGLLRLRQAGKIKTKGSRSTTTYTAS